MRSSPHLGPLRAGLLLAATLLAGGCADDLGAVRVTASAGTEAREGRISPEETADGWIVRFDSAVLAITEVRFRSMDGQDAAVPFQAAAAELVPLPQELAVLEEVPAQRWDRVGYRLGPPPEDVRNLGVAQQTLDRMVREGWSAYYAGSLQPPDGTTDGDGNPVPSISFEYGFPVDVTYDFCINGLDRTDGIVVPPSSTVEVELTWHLTHLFFDSFAEAASLRVEPFAARWSGTGPLTVDDLDVSLASLSGVDGSLLRDDQGNPVVFVPGATAVETLREFLLETRPGHFNGLEGFCNTDVTRLR
jgi:hypothetical protein